MTSGVPASCGSVSTYCVARRGNNGSAQPAAWSASVEAPAPASARPTAAESVASRLPATASRQPSATVA